VGTGFLIYMIIPIFLGLRANAQTLIDEPFIMARMSFWGGAIALGVWGTTLSSAIGSILGAPRVLQALVRDNIFPKSLSFLGQGAGKNDEPRLGTAVTLGIAVAAVCLGDLNLIAPILTMFFLTTYLVLNASAGIESFLDSPSFRPTFKIHWSLSVMGALGCLGVMFLINAIATIFAAIIVLGIYLYLQRQELEVTWGDSRRGMWMALVRTGIYQVEEEIADPKNWRPHILTFFHSPQKNWSLVKLADSFNHKGFLTVASVIPQRRDYQSKQNLENTVKEYLTKNQVQGLVKIIRSDDTFGVIPQLVESYGIGALIPNTIILGSSTAWLKEDWETHQQYSQMVTQIHELKRNILILKQNPQQQLKQYRRIDVWWGGIQANGSLMILLAYLLKNDWDWSRANIYLKLVVRNPNALKSTKNNIKALIEKLNIELIPEIIVSDESSFETILKENSQGADLIFLGLASPAENFAQYYHSWLKRTENLPTIAFVMAANDFPFEEVLQKEG